jgi:hypothetical protein
MLQKVHKITQNLSIIYRDKKKVDQILEEGKSNLPKETSKYRKQPLKNPLGEKICREQISGNSEVHCNSTTDKIFLSTQKINFKNSTLNFKNNYNWNFIKSLFASSEEEK